MPSFFKSAFALAAGHAAVGGTLRKGIHPLSKAEGKIAQDGTRQERIGQERRRQERIRQERIRQERIRQERRRQRIEKG